MKSDLLTAKEAAEYLRVSASTLKKMDKEILPAQTPGGNKRYKVKWLNDYLNGSKGKRSKRKW